jgi:uncharacterized membrane protein YdjX (TVP38/TMEM64 family)
MAVKGVVPGSPSAIDNASDMVFRPSSDRSRMQISSNQDAVPAPGSRFCLARCWPLALVAAISVTVIAMGWHKELSLAALVEHRAAIDAFTAEHRFAALALLSGFYALVVALSLPGAVFLTIFAGVIYGTLVGGLAALIGATAGATAIFLIARSALGGWLVHRAGPRAEKLAAGFRADAFSYLLFLRLVPLFPFWLVNLVPALCGVTLRTFVAATALGIIPGTFAFAFFGAGLDSAVEAQAAVYRACVAGGTMGCELSFDLKTAATPQLVAGLVALGVLALVPIAIKRLRAARGVA